MTKKEVIKHFGNQAKTARAVGISRQAVCQWEDKIPDSIGWKIHVISGGKLKMDVKNES